MNDGLQKRNREDTIMTILYKQVVILFGGVLIIGWLLSLDEHLLAFMITVLMFVILEYNSRKMESKQEPEPVVEL